MSISLLFLTLLNIILLAGLSFSLFLRVKEKKEDIKLTKGLQLLQNKLSILQDLSDRTDEQVQKVVHLLDQKTQEMRALIKESDLMMDELTIMAEKSVNQRTTEKSEPATDNSKAAIIVKAAQLAHAGASLEQIRQETQLSPSEIQMIMAVNKNQLQFAADQLPAWLKQTSVAPISQQEMNDFSQALQKQNQTVQKPAASVINSSQVKPVAFRKI